MSGKTGTFVLDFINDPDSISASFQKFYQSLSLEEETDPNKLYDIQSSIKGFNLFVEEEVDTFCKIFYDKNRDEGLLHPVLDEIVDRWNEFDIEQREDFRLKILSYNRLYSYLSQIVNFTDIQLEKHYLFYRYLSKKLTRESNENLDIGNLIDLESLRVQKLHTSVDPLENTDFGYEGISTNPKTYQDPKSDFLSEIIEIINSKYSVNLNDDDRVNLESVRKRIFEDKEISKYMNGKNSEQNKEDYMKKQFDTVMLEFLNSRFDFFKKIDDDDSLKKLIFDKIYSDYTNNQNKNQDKNFNI